MPAAEIQASCIFSKNLSISEKLLLPLVIKGETTTRYSLLFTRYSLLFYSLLLLFTRYSLLFTGYSLHFTRQPLPITRNLSFFTCYSLPFTRYSLHFISFSILLTRYSLFFTCYLLRFNFLLVTHYDLDFRSVTLQTPLLPYIVLEIKMRDR